MRRHIHPWLSDRSVIADSQSHAKENQVDWVEDALEQLHDEGSEYVVSSETVADYLDSGWTATYSDYFNGVKVVCMIKNSKDAAIVDCGDKRIVRAFE